MKEVLKLLTNQLEVFKDMKSKYLTLKQSFINEGIENKMVNKIIDDYQRQIDDLEKAIKILNIS